MNFAPPTLPNQLASNVKTARKWPILILMNWKKAIIWNQMNKFTFQRMGVHCINRIYFPFWLIVSIWSYPWINKSASPLIHLSAFINQTKQHLAISNWKLMRNKSNWCKFHRVQFIVGKLCTHAHRTHPHEYIFVNSKHIILINGYAFAVF